MKTAYIDNDKVNALLLGMNLENRIACEVALATGWRISDILKLTVLDIQQAQKNNGRITIVEQKTGKKSKRTIPHELLVDMFSIAGTYYVFESRDYCDKPRSRQAVYKDIKAVAKKFGFVGNVSPHSLRKNYAVGLREQGLTMEQVKKKMNHYNADTTLIYAMADHIEKVKDKAYKRSNKPRKPKQKKAT